MFLQNPPEQLSNYPVVIFGSGPAGYATAMRLAERRIASLVIEAGALRADARRQNAVADHEGHGHYDGRHWRAHSIIRLGGTSAVWGGACMSLERRDFADWPISYDDLSPHYRRAAKLFGRDPRLVDYRKPWMDTLNFKPYSFSDAPLRLASRAEALRANKWIHIATDKILKHLVLGPGATRVSAAVLIDARSREERAFIIPKTAKIVLALGGIGNAQMLLQPGENGAPSFFARKGAAGHYLMEHPYIPNDGGMMVALDQSARFPKTQAADGEFGRILPLYLNSDRVWERAGGIGCLLRFLPLLQPDREARTLAEQRLTAPRYYNMLVRFEMKANHANHIRLAGKNPYGMHSAVAHCVFGAQDLAGVERTLQEFARELGDKGLGFVRIANESIYRKALGQGHIMGTTRMGGNPSNSVVDRNAKVHELANLYLAGSSVFPNGGTATPTLTIAALAQRLADHIGGKHGD
ncbi:MAG: GMC oxidoreductase [Gammaproteobacteria bacterium]